MTIFAQAQAPQNALEAALRNEGTITVLANSSGATLKTLQVNPSEAQLGTPGTQFLLYILNPARLAIESSTSVLPDKDLYQVPLPRTIRENRLTAVVGAQFSGTRYTGTCGVTILSNRGNVFKVQVNGSGTFYDESNNRTPATVVGVFEVTYIGDVSPLRQQQSQQTPEQQQQQAMEMIQGLLNQR
jgi:hypothetical protein